MDNTTGHSSLWKGKKSSSQLVEEKLTLNKLTKDQFKLPQLIRKIRTPIPSCDPL